MQYHVPHRRSSGKGMGRRLGEKVFSYFTTEERKRLDLAAKRQDMSLSSFVAKAANGEADRVLGPVPVFVPEPLSLDRIVQALKGRTKESEIEGLIQANGISFVLTEQAEKSLRKAGVGPELLLRIYKAVRP